MKIPDAFAVGVASHTGYVRINNEDDYLLSSIPPGERELILCAIADGMGGAAGGAEASRAALRALGGAVLDRELGPLPERLGEGFHRAAERVFEQASAVPALRGMGTTLTALCLEPGRAVFGHVGDTRLYRLREGRLEQMTEDHAVREPDNLLTRCIGGGRRECQPDHGSFPTEAGERFVLLSDGVWSVVDDEAIEVLARCESPQEAADALVCAALAAGGPDNATAVVADVLETAPSGGTRDVDLDRRERPGIRDGWPRPRSLRPPVWPWMAIGAALLLLLVAGLRWWGGIDLVAVLLQKW